MRAALLSFVLLAACAAPPIPAGPRVVVAPLEGAQVVFRTRTGVIALALDHRDSVVLTLVGRYKGYKEGTTFRLQSVGDDIFLVIEEP